MRLAPSELRNTIGRFLLTITIVMVAGAFAMLLQQELQVEQGAAIFFMAVNLVVFVCGAWVAGLYIDEARRERDALARLTVCPPDRRELGPCSA